MALPPEFGRPDSLLERLFDHVLGQHSTLPRRSRYVVGALGLAGYLTLSRYVAGFGALALAIGYYGILQRWAIEEPAPGELADAHAWAVVTGMIAIGAFAVWWWFLGPAWLQQWATHIWLPMGVVGVALAFDRYRRPPTATESIGQALSRAGRRPRNASNPSDPPPA